MKAVMAFFVISIILLSGCTSKIVETGNVQDKQATETTPELSKPQTTSTKGTTQEAEITTGTTTEVTKAPEEPTQLSEPRTFQVNVVQGIGIREGPG